MSRMLEIPDTLYAALEEAASAAGLTPIGWIAAHLPQATVADSEKVAADPKPAKTLAERFAGHVGLIDCDYEERLPERAGELFAEHLVEKRRAGRL